MSKKQKSNLLKSSSPATPTNTYQRSNIYTVSDVDVVEVPKSARGKRTSVSCFQDTKNKLHSLITIMDTKNVDEVIDKLIDSYLEVMSDEEVNEYRLIAKSLDKRTIKRK